MDIPTPQVLYITDEEEALLLQLDNLLPDDLWRVVEEYCQDWSTFFSTQTHWPGSDQLNRRVLATSEGRVFSCNTGG